MTTRQICCVAGAVLGLCGPAASQPFFVDVTDSVFVRTPFQGWGWPGATTTTTGG
ncbi:MAG: hypothetical protein AB1505_19370 [Candidatus Latescibacterota bacterium]